ncbi:MAG: cyclic nucleotide-binding domain-containing protein [Verrucomicrobiae bacterium]|nr:cyclic nucleotide-binding domain-containing protein [Verrucomicrobiae bacterium]
MNPPVVAPTFRVWALDDSVYGPVTLEVLQDWVRDERVVSDSWVFCETSRRWQPACQMAGLRLLFGQEEAPAADLEARPRLKPSILRRIRAFGDLSDEDLHDLSPCGDVVQLPAFQTVMRANTPSDAIYFVIEGQVRQRIHVRQREILIAVKEAGSAFGYISLFDGGPHVTDAITDSPATLFRIPTVKLREFCAQRPEAGVGILFSLGRSLAQRIRSDDRHLYELVALNQGRN